MSEDKRQHPRMIVNFPVQAQVGEIVVEDLNVTDISATGMQIQSADFDTLKGGFDTSLNQAHFELQMDARLAWVQNASDGSFLTGWEFVFGRSNTDRGIVLKVEPEGKRRHDRLSLELPIRAQVGAGNFEELELVDVSPSGMQLRCMDFDAIKDGLEPTGNRAQFTILLQARLAWVQTAENQEFLTGWEFGEDTGEERIG
ncbi:MAG: PilZ domain-containing protein [Candidatus Latescibacteria bacterium]|jgi:hypothetical protein|nr:PilZ domain-containing protein [Candidatus Latescibacterota bacterium]MBT4140591.1 PilZ domain-containing protein [Candidatus Latescibacterota bacterium]